MPKPGAAATGDDVIAFCKERIAHYNCPRSVHVRDESPPFSGAGKVLKRELREPFREGARQAG